MRGRFIFISDTRHKMAVPEEEDANDGNSACKRCPNVIAMMTKGIERAFFRVVQRN